MLNEEINWKLNADERHNEAYILKAHSLSIVVDTVQYLKAVIQRTFLKGCK